MGKVIFRAFICGLAGLAAWAVTEPFAPQFIPVDPTKHTGSGQAWLILLIGALVGLAAGLLQGLGNGSRKQALILASLGFLFGAIGSTFGASIGEMLTQLVFHTSTGGVAYLNQPERTVARALSILPIGLCMGLAIGLTLKSKRGLLAGIVGGTIGGIVTGFGFDTVADLLGHVMATAQSGTKVPPGMMLEVGGPSRAVLAAGLGVAVGLFVALIDQVTRQAWVRLVLGRNEGREWPIDGEKTLIGRDERANVPLFGDMNVAPLHAIIFKQGSQYVIQDQNTGIGIGVNNQRVATAALNPGDSFQIGSHNLQFLMKESAARAMHEGRAHGQPVGAPGQSAPIQPIAQPGQAPAQVPQHMQPYQQAVSQPTQAFTAPAQAPSGFALVATSGPITGQRFNVSTQMEAGREATGIALGFDQQASRRHAAFTPTSSGLQVQDLGSTNGTMVNGNRVQSATLNRGDVVQIGSTMFRVE
ncbi:MAG TPA: FHA domain-containing protein [Fimbriimonadaceae bacterium]|nr:FHA domain-containing protein [Fimbriimonadaceae bacterium]